MLKDLAMKAYQNDYVKAFEKIFGLIPENVHGSYFSVIDMNFRFDYKTLDGSYWWRLAEPCPICNEIKLSHPFTDLAGMGKQLEKGFITHGCNSPNVSKKVRNFTSREVIFESVTKQAGEIELLDVPIAHKTSALNYSILVLILGILIDIRDILAGETSNEKRRNDEEL